MKHSIAVIATGTEVGKTHASVTLVLALRSQGIDAAGLKPVESGVVAGGLTDDVQLARASSFAIPGRRPLEREAQPYAFARPVSPHLAARDEGRRIETAVAASWVARQPGDVHVVETAGALLSPLSEDETNLDLIRSLRPDAVVLVAPDRLGVLHEVRATMLAQRALAPELPQPVVVLQAPGSPDASTGTNAVELRSLGIAERVFTFPRAQPQDAIPAALAVLDAIGASRSS